MFSGDSSLSASSAMRAAVSGSEEEERFPIRSSVKNGFSVRRRRCQQTGGWGADRRAPKTRDQGRGTV